MAINLVDIVIVVALLVGLANGYRRGFWLSLFQYLGMVAGVVVGAAVALPLLSALGVSSTTLRPLAAAAIVLVGGSAGSTLGYWLSEPLRNAVLRRGIAHPPEMLAGALFSGIAVLSVSWFLGLTFSRGPSPDLARVVQQSVILRRLDAFFPRPPGFTSGVQQVLAGVPFPQTFAGLAPPSAQPLELPASADTPQVRAAEASVYRVEGRGCGGVVSGSAYPVAPGYLITNAHVVSGTSGTTLSQASGTRRVNATVVLFDSRKDVAILYAPGIASAALVASDGGRGTQGAVIGYPGGGDETVSAAVIDKSTSAEGRDIYSNSLVTRQIWIVESQVRPGNSGGPLVDLQGHVLGLVFAASSSNPSQAYALTNAEVQDDIRQGVTRPQRVDTSGFDCAV
ncbi:MAG: MarP family serine protease [Candidatus Dormibacteraeota bacterium]|nr:MarP family serine protease [Candidatus Dormibacteraeota bacterium]MDQ6920887.1 MarP family serine protease [Candidatus Dormibacteraeota bacterium]